jgi:hypothetical protein
LLYLNLQMQKQQCWICSISLFNAAGSSPQRHKGHKGKIFYLSS